MNKDERIDNFNEIAKSVVALEEVDFNVIEEMIEDQKSYSHPFKHGTAMELNKIGNHNEKILTAVRELKRVIVEENPFK